MCAPEQTGKTSAWIIGLLWTFLHKPCLSLVVYPSLDLAVKINEDKLKPLMLDIPRLAAELANPRSKRVDCYNFSSLRSYFMGAGQPITSISAKVCVADEIDDWQEHEGQIASLEDLRKRGRSFAEAILFKVCTPRGSAEGSTIWAEFLRSSRGYWHLRCKGCGELTMRSCDIHNLQFKASEDGILEEGSCRLVCPTCGAQHEERCKRRMNLDGGYKHEQPELIAKHPGYQWGALASQLPALSWDTIAKAQLLAGRSGDYKDQLYFDNSIRGLPYHKRKAQDHEDKQLTRHCIDYPAADFRAIIAGIDTQDDGFFYVVRGFDIKRNSYLLAHGKAPTFNSLDDALDRPFLGHGLTLAIIDQGGHRAREVVRWVYSRKRTISYKGSTVYAGGRLKTMSEDPRGVIANPKIYQAELLYAIYGKEKSTDEGNWFLPLDVSADYREQIIDMKPCKKKRNGNDFREWEGSGNDHYFDAEKMVLVGLDYAKENKLIGQAVARTQTKRTPATYSSM